MLGTSLHSHCKQRSAIPAQPPSIHGASLVNAPQALPTMPKVSSRSTIAADGRTDPLPTLKPAVGIVAEKQNARSAALVELLGRILIEKLFFQQLQIPQEVLLSLMNNVIQTIAPAQKTKIDLYREGVILSKQFMGKALTPDEQRYEDALKEIDVPGEIMNGIRYSAMALMGSNLCTSISSAINQGLWSHVPAIAGYTGAIAFGPKLIQGVVEKVLVYRRAKLSDTRSEKRGESTPDACYALV